MAMMLVSKIYGERLSTFSQSASYYEKWGFKKKKSVLVFFSVLL